MTIIIKTKRLIIRYATIKDASDFYRLWKDPRVMTNVGFPNGMQITREEVESALAEESGTPIGTHLSVVLPGTGEFIGEAWIGPPDQEGISDTDIKLLPEYWGQRYGVEVKRALLDYLFIHTDAKAVRATPNVENTASIRMQEAVGGKRVGEAVGEFPEAMRAYTKPVHHYIYLVSKEDWQAMQDQASYLGEPHDTPNTHRKFEQDVRGPRP